MSEPRFQRSSCSVRSCREPPCPIPRGAGLLFSLHKRFLNPAGGAQVCSAELAPSSQAQPHSPGHGLHLPWLPEAPAWAHTQKWGVSVKGDEEDGEEGSCVHPRNVSELIWDPQLLAGLCWQLQAPFCHPPQSAARCSCLGELSSAALSLAQRGWGLSPPITITIPLPGIPAGALLVLLHSPG